MKRHYPLWVIMSAVFAIVTPLTLFSVATAFNVRLETTLREELANQLSSSMQSLTRSNFNEALMERLEDRGTHILVFDEQTNEVLFRSGASTHVLSARTGDETADEVPHTVMDEAIALYSLVYEWVGKQDGSVILTDSEIAERMESNTLKTKELYLFSRSGSILSCLSLPVESTQSAFQNAVMFVYRVSLVVWVAFLGMFVHATRQISKRYRRIAEVAARMAKLDFSQRCPETFSRELEDLRLSLNTMGDYLEDHIRALRESNSKLKLELNERVRQQKVTADLLGNLAHDLKTPIAIVSGYAEGLADGLARTPEKQQSYYDAILRESERMQSLVSRLLTLGKMESGETPIIRRSFDLNAMLDELLDSFQREIERQELYLTWTGSEPCMVRSDFECTRQSLTNYIQNAIYHINNGNHIEVRVEERGAMIRVRVLNSSAPIPPEKIRKLWDKLYRGDPSRQRKHGEMGLGLSIVKGNMERLGQAYGCENVPDFPGVCFWLEMPKAPGSDTANRQERKQ